jgi:outer membrane protein
MKRAVSLAALALVAVLVAHAAAQEAGTDIKIAVIDMQRVIAESTAGKAMQDRVQGFINAKAAELNTEKQTLQREEADLENQRSVLSAEAYQSRRNQLEQKVLGFRQKSQAADREYQTLYQQELRKFIESAAPVIERLGEEGNFTMIVDRNDQGLLYYSKALDITDQALERLNAATGAGQ